MLLSENLLFLQPAPLTPGKPDILFIGSHSLPSLSFLFIVLAALTITTVGIALYACHRDGICFAEVIIPATL